MKTIEYPGCYASKWSLTDLYPEAEKLLREAIASGEDFDTLPEWGCKKEIRAFRVTRENGEYHISVMEEMDDFYEGDLVYDAVWEVFREEKELTDEQMDEIIDRGTWADISDIVWMTEDVTAEGKTYEDLMEIVERLEEEACRETTRMFERLCNIVRCVLEVDE